MQSGFSGISFPFRVNANGSIVTSTTSATDFSHIKESISQILNTGHLERPMESDIYSNIDVGLFEPNDIPLQQVLRKRIKEALDRLEPRISIKESGIEFSDTNRDKGILNVELTFKVLQFNTTVTENFRIGG